jgi:ribosomal-protein-alanine N-acetyltransferase
VKVTLASAAHLALLAALHDACFEDAWDEGALAALLATPGAFALVMTDEAEEPAGFVIGRAAAGECEMLSLGVVPEARRRGLGRHLVTAFAGHARKLAADELFLEVAEDNYTARALYAVAGFTQVGRRAGYYRSAAGARATLVLRATLRPS